MSLTQLELEFQWTWIAPKHWSQRLHLKSEVRFFCFQQGFYNSTRAWTLALKKTSSSGVVGSFYYETIQLHQRNSVLHQHTFKLSRSLWNPHGLFFFSEVARRLRKLPKRLKKTFPRKHRFQVVQQAWRDDFTAMAGGEVVKMCEVTRPPLAISWTWSTTRHLPKEISETTMELIDFSLWAVGLRGSKPERAETQVAEVEKAWELPWEPEYYTPIAVW